MARSTTREESREHAARRRDPDHRGRQALRPRRPTRTGTTPTGTDGDSRRHRRGSGWRATPTRTTATQPEMVDRQLARTGSRPRHAPDHPVQARPVPSGTSRALSGAPGLVWGTLPRTSRPLPVNHLAPRGAALARCLDPVDAGTFLAEHWEQRPLVVPRDEPGRFDDLLSEADVERLVCSTAIRYPGFRLVRRGEPALRRRLRQGRLLAAAVHGHGRRPARRRRVGRGCDHRPAGAARQLAPARGLLPLCSRTRSAAASR